MYKRQVRVNASEKRRIGGHAADRKAGRAYAKPKGGIANPGNVTQQTYTAKEVSELLATYESGDVRKCNVGGGQMGSKLANENEAPFPESLAEFYVKSFCPPGGVVLDCFSGSGTTAAVAVKNDRNFLACDVRKNQIELGECRIAEINCPI